jgi:hypothetical protein
VNASRSELCDKTCYVLLPLSAVDTLLGSIAALFHLLTLIYEVFILLLLLLLAEIPGVARDSR